MSDAGLLVLIVIAIAIGWSLGRSERKRREFTYLDWSQDYLQGVQSLFKEKPNEAIELLLSSLEKSTNTLEVRLALAGFYRKRGEVDQAIKIHQSLLAEPNLDPKQLSAVELALARDYLSAGLLDRAERLLQGLVREGSFCKTAALEHLVRIYEQEKEWKNAIECAEMLVKAGQPVMAQLAQYQCEEAERFLLNGETENARKHLQEALKVDKKSVRASMVLARIEFQFLHYDQTIRWLKKVRFQDAHFVSETLDLAQKSFQALGKIDEFKEYLQLCYEETHAIVLLLAWVQVLMKEGQVKTALEKLKIHLTETPSLRGMLEYVVLIEKQASAVDLGMSEVITVELKTLHDFLVKMIEQRAQYICRHCGFKGHSLHWLCPGCHHWGVIKPLANLEV